MKIVLPILILAILGLVTFVAIKSRKEPEMKKLERILPAVEVIELKSQDYQLTVNSSGVVEAPTITELTAEVTGRVLKCSEQFENGGFFSKGDVLLQIDDADYRVALASAQSSLAEAKYQLAMEEAEGEQAKKDWELLGKGEANELVLRKPQLARAKAMVVSAEAAVAKAQRDLEKTKVYAPYDGRVTEALVDVGQYIGAPGTKLGVIFSTDVAEVRLAISDKQASLINLPLYAEDSVEKASHSKMQLSVNYGDKDYFWDGHVSRVEGLVDRSTRMFYLVGSIPEPYRKRSEGQPPLKVGMFVSAAIQGKSMQKVFVLPRVAMLESDLVLIVDEKNRLQRRKVSVAQTEGDKVIIISGLKDGERVSVTPLEYVVDGMEVKGISGDLKD